MPFTWMTREEARTMGQSIGVLSAPLFLLGMSKLVLPEGVSDVIKENFSAAIAGACGAWAAFWMVLLPVLIGGREQSGAAQARNEAIATVATAPEGIERHELAAQIGGAKP